MFTSTSPQTTAAIVSADAGDYVDGRWIPERRLNGDDTILDYTAAQKSDKYQSGQGVRLAAGQLRIVRIKVYRF